MEGDDDDWQEREPELASMHKRMSERLALGSLAHNLNSRDGTDERSPPGGLDTGTSARLNGKTVMPSVRTKEDKLVRRKSKEDKSSTNALARSGASWDVDNKGKGKFMSSAATISEGVDQSQPDSLTLRRQKDWEELKKGYILSTSKDSKQPIQLPAYENKKERRKEDGGRRKEGGGRREEAGSKEEEGRRKEDGGRKKEEGRRRKEEGRKDEDEEGKHGPVLPGVPLDGSTVIKSKKEHHSKKEKMHSPGNSSPRSDLTSSREIPSSASSLFRRQKQSEAEKMAKLRNKQEALEKEVNDLKQKLAEKEKKHAADVSATSDLNSKEISSSDPPDRPQKFSSEEGKIATQKVSREHSKNPRNSDASPHHGAMPANASSSSNSPEKRQMPSTLESLPRAPPSVNAKENIASQSPSHAKEKTLAPLDVVPRTSRPGTKSPAENDNLNVLTRPTVVRRPVRNNDRVASLESHHSGNERGQQGIPRRRTNEDYDQKPDVETRKPSKDTNNWLTASVRFAKHHKLPLRQVQKDVWDFRAMDTDGDGKISMEQFTKFLAAKCSPSLLEEMETFIEMEGEKADVDGSGDIDLEEYLLWNHNNAFREDFCGLKESELNLRELARDMDLSFREVEDIRDVFNRFDRDGSGSIDKPEFRQVIMELFKTKNESDVMEARFERYWKEADKTKEGGIELEEFIHWYLKYFKTPDGGADMPVVHTYAQLGTHRFSVCNQMDDW